jgi:acyl CoA:acetate/3-ketoacid CoA transferase alpha subunit
LDKVFPSIDAAVADIPDGASIAISGFFTAGTPVPLIQALARQGAKNLTICRWARATTPSTIS